MEHDDEIKKRIKEAIESITSQQRFVVRSEFKVEINEKGALLCTQPETHFKFFPEFLDSIILGDKKEESITKGVFEVITAALCQSLIMNIHKAHENKKIDSANHLRKIISILEEGFVSTQKVEFKHKTE